MIGHVEPVLTLPIGLEVEIAVLELFGCWKPRWNLIWVSLYDSLPQLKAPYKFLLKGLY